MRSNFYLQPEQAEDDLVENELHKEGFTKNNK